MCLRWKYTVKFSLARWHLTFFHQLNAGRLSSKGLFYSLLRLMMGCVCLTVHLGGSTPFIDLLPDSPPTHLSCPNVILLSDTQVYQMITISATVGFPAVDIYKRCHFTVNILTITVFMLKSVSNVNIFVIIASRRIHTIRIQTCWCKWNRWELIKMTIISSLVVWGQVPLSSDAP